MNIDIKALFKFLKQPSTHKGLIAVCAVFGMYLSPEHIEAISSVSILAYGGYQIFRNEDKQIGKSKG